MGKRTRNSGRFLGASAGFTLVEMIMVLLILSIVGAVVVSRVVSSSEYTLESRTQILKSHLRYAQGRSMNSSVVWGISFPGGSSYSLFRNGNPADVVALPGEGAAVLSLPSGMSVADSAGTGIISFDGWGSPCTDAGGAVPQGARTLTVSYDGKSRTIVVTPNTGFIP